MAVAINVEIIETAKTEAEATLDSEKSIVDESISALEQSISDIIAKYSDPNTYKTMAEDILTNALALVTSAYESMKTKVISLYDNIVAQIANITALPTGTGTGIAAQASQLSNINSTLNLIQTKIDAITTIITQITSLVDQAIALAQEAINSALNVGFGILQDVGDKITGVVNDVLVAPIAVLETHVNKAIVRADENIAKVLAAETVVQETTGRLPGEEDYVVDPEAFGNKKSVDQEAMQAVTALANIERGTANIAAIT